MLFVSQQEESRLLDTLIELKFSEILLDMNPKSDYIKYITPDIEKENNKEKRCVRINERK